MSESNQHSSSRASLARQRRPKRRSRQRRGASLIEVVIVCAVFALGMITAARSLQQSVLTGADQTGSRVVSLTALPATPPEPTVAPEPAPPPPEEPQQEESGWAKAWNITKAVAGFVIDNSPIGDIKTLADPNASFGDKLLAGVSLASSVIPGVGTGVKAATTAIKLGTRAAKDARKVERAAHEVEDIEGAAAAAGKRRRAEEAASDEKKPGAENAADEKPEPKAGNTKAAQIGKDVHKTRADERRASGDWDDVNTHIVDDDGATIEVPHRVNKRGEPIGDRTQRAQPDAVSYKRGEILDDKPAGRPLSKDKQEIIRFITAYKAKTGKLPDKIIIDRYNPADGSPAGVQIYPPEFFLPPGTL